MAKTAHLVNQRPVGAYEAVHGLFCVFPLNIMYPAQSQMNVIDVEPFNDDLRILKTYNHILKLYNGLKLLFISLCLQTVIKHNRRTDGRRLAIGDIVLILD